jgi:glycolate oxidase FAD binding subunit
VQAAEILKYADEQGLKVAIRGGGTKTGLGNPITGLDIVLSTANLNQITEHIPADLTLGLQAGANLQKVQDELEQHEQFLPLASPLASRATVGGAVAANTSGAWRLQYGPVRDWLIGVKFVLADGTQAKGGGRVVKNVAGFDMMKVMIGSLGTLGLITEMNFKLMPLPKAFGTLLLTLPSPKTASQVALKIIRAGLFPSALTILDTHAAAQLGLDKLADEKVVLAVEVRNTKQAVERQLRDIYQLSVDEVGQPITYTDLTERAVQKSWERQLADFAYSSDVAVATETATTDNYNFALKLATLPTQAIEAVEIARHIALNQQIEIATISHVGHGISYVKGQLSDNTDLIKLGQVISETTAKIQTLGGTVTAERVPFEIKPYLTDVWGTALSAGELKLMRGFKQKLDPHSTLNPGRFVDKI